MYLLLKAYMSEMFYSLICRTVKSTVLSGMTLFAFCAGNQSSPSWIIYHDTSITYLHIVCFFKMFFFSDPTDSIRFLLSLFIFTSIILILQACLGSKAKPNEKNLVQVTTTDSSDSTVTFAILSLTSGKSDQV